jgi:hypothetical protein
MYVVEKKSQGGSFYNTTKDVNIAQLKDGSNKHLLTFLFLQFFNYKSVYHRYSLGTSIYSRTDKECLENHVVSSSALSPLDESMFIVQSNTQDK